jgi:hypothetical protein
MNKSALSIRLKNENINFLKTTSKEENLAVSWIIDASLDLYRKYKIKKDLMEEADLETEEDRKEANSDIIDYIKIIDKY